MKTAEEWAYDATITLSGTTYSGDDWHEVTGRILRAAFAACQDDAIDACAKVANAHRATRMCHIHRCQNVIANDIRALKVRP